MSFPRFNRRARKARRDPLPDAIAALGEAPAAPDFAGSILDRVHQQRPFFETHTQTAIRWTKIVAGSLATGLALLAGTAVWFAPEILPWAAEPRPISAVVRGAVGDAQTGMNRLDALRRSVASLSSRDAEAPSFAWIDPGVSKPLARATGVARPDSAPIGMLPLRVLWGSTGESARPVVAKAAPAQEVPAWFEPAPGSDGAASGWDQVGSSVTPQ